MRFYLNGLPSIRQKSRGAAAFSIFGYSSANLPHLVLRKTEKGAPLERRTIAASHAGRQTAP